MPQEASIQPQDGLLQPIWIQLGPKLAPSWPKLGPRLPQVGSNLPQVGPTLVPFAGPKPILIRNLAENVRLEIEIGSKSFQNASMRGGPQPYFESCTPHR